MTTKASQLLASAGKFVVHADGSAFGAALSRGCRFHVGPLQ